MDRPEHRAYQAVAAFQAEQRAMSEGTPTAGGYMVPLPTAGFLRDWLAQALKGDR